MTKTLHGKAHGKTIELDEDLGVPEGQIGEACHAPFDRLDCFAFCEDNAST